MKVGGMGTSCCSWILLLALMSTFGCMKKSDEWCGTSLDTCCNDDAEVLQNVVEMGTRGGILVGPTLGTVEVPPGAMSDDEILMFNIASGEETSGIEWTPISSETDPNSATVSAQVTEFSYFQVGVVGDGNSYEGVGPVYSLHPLGQVFDVPVIVTLPYNPDSIPDGADADELTILGVACIETKPENPPGTWTDPTSCLMWQNPPADQTYLWAEAKTYCEILQLAGFTDWRLPTISELRTLVRGCPGTMTGGACAVTDTCLEKQCVVQGDCWDCENTAGPADGCYWPHEMQGDCAFYWSSSPTNGQDTEAWDITFYAAEVNYGDTYYDSHARCVRSTSSQ